MSPTPSAQTEEAPTRPRVEGEREQEILDSTIDILAEVGYDRLTMDAVATRAKASKATLYRRWNSKAQLVIDALTSQKEHHDFPDTGNLRDDLLGAFCGMGGLTDGRQLAILGSVITAIGRDEEFAERFRQDFIGPKKAMSAAMFRRAQERGEIRGDLDLDLIAAALPGIVLHRAFLLGDPPTPELIAKVVDQLILPAVTLG
ncbi:TetR/AcrR family transcriptional regulator [Nocardioides humilatus]|uniref:TetR/AcrR family transcriptional regulator n=1 Tax=Nocardioides humilatus TaxID=2607660 RepID=A0A5B1LDZ2_9ACTN|nr:TetR/AcrR family transcriptional regulator [Nocardioides humilatus]KAA1418666.1 TetR/AcrR family transcriptional regulator [Nocardioides humilatus]